MAYINRSPYQLHYDPSNDESKNMLWKEQNNRFYKH